MDLGLPIASIFFALAILFALRYCGRKAKQEKLTKSVLYKAYIASPEWDKLRKEALEFFNYRCAACNSPLNLDVHHRWYPSLLGTEKVKINGRVGHLIVFCRDHHHMAPRSAGLYKG